MDIINDNREVAELGGGQKFERKKFEGGNIWVQHPPKHPLSMSFSNIFAACSACLYICYN